MDWQDLTSETGTGIAWSCVKTKIIEAACTWASSPWQEAKELPELRGWSRLHSVLLAIPHTEDFPPLTADMAMVDLFAECAGVCQFCAALAVQFHPPDVDLSDLIGPAEVREP